MTTTAIAEGFEARHASVLIIGGGDVGSAIAHHLFRHGLRVLVADRAGSTHARRGMAFTDAAFDGSARLDGIEAHWQPDLAGVEACWTGAAAIPLVTLPEDEVLSALAFDVLVEATMRRNRVPPDLRSCAPLSIGLGPGYMPGHNCHAAIETQWGEQMGRVLRDRPAAARCGGPYALNGVRRERFGIAPAAGLWSTQAVIGIPVCAGDPLGSVGENIVVAPLKGMLRGVTRDGVAVMAGQRVIEVDPRTEPQVHGLGERPIAIAAGVVAALGLGRNA